MRILRCEEGLTLVETIIALVLMLVLIAAFAGAMTVALQREVEVDKRLEASNLASGIVEYLGEGDNLKELIVTLGNYDYYGEYQNEDLKVYFYEDDFPVSDFDEDISLDYDESYVSIELYDDNDLYRLVVFVKWEDRGNDWTHELVTLLAVD